MGPEVQPHTPMGTEHSFKQCYSGPRAASLARHKFVRVISCCFNNLSHIAVCISSLWCLHEKMHKHARVWLRVTMSNHYDQLLFMTCGSLPHCLPEKKFSHGCVGKALGWKTEGPQFDSVLRAQHTTCCDQQLKTAQINNSHVWTLHVFKLFLLLCNLRFRFLARPRFTVFITGLLDWKT